MPKNSAVLIGLCCGDALGMPFETKNWNHPELLAWDGHTFHSSEWHKLKPGQYTDDGGMALALTESLFSHGRGDQYDVRARTGFEPQRVAAFYSLWHQGPTFRGAGQTTRKALENLKNGVPWYESGELGALGNGTAMRVAPLGVFYKDEPTKLIKAAKLDAIITHNSHEAQQGSVAIAMAISLLLNGVKKEEILDSIKRVLEPSRVLDNLELISTNKVIHDTLKNKSYDRELDKKGGNRIISQLILGGKYTVIEVVARAFYTFVATKSFEEAMELTIRGGGDSDTAAAIVGALCGAYYGLEGIPKDYIKQVENSDYLLSMDERLYSGK